MSASDRISDRASEILVPVKRALLSVSDKTGIIDFARFLAGSGVELISTGGTAEVLGKAGIPVTLIEAWTGSPECFDGRLKTLTPKVYGGILYKRDDAHHQADADRLGFESVDLVVCNLYPFADHVAKGSSDSELIENIDIGGPSMIRAAAKNHQHVLICTRPSQYDEVREAMIQSNGQTGFDLRRRFAVDAFCLTAEYDAVISTELSRRFTGVTKAQLGFPGYSDPVELRYGENPHQNGMLMRRTQNSRSDSAGVANAEILQGKELSWNNLLDADGAWRLASDLSLLASRSDDQGAKTALGAGVAIIKHGNPCGASLGRNGVEALKSAWQQDATSAFGSVIASTVEICPEMAAWLSDKFCEVILAPSYSSSAMAILNRKKSLRLLKLDLLAPQPEMLIRSISGGLLIQQEDSGLDPEAICVTEDKSVMNMLPLARFGVVLAKHLKSNAIALVAETRNGFELVGAGMGQPNRIDSFVRLAFPRAEANMGPLGINTSDLVMASDAFFPFADTVEAAASAGIRSIVQPGGSIRDEEVIAACNRLKVSMLMTGRRHFRH